MPMIKVIAKTVGQRITKARSDLDSVAQPLLEGNSKNYRTTPNEHSLTHIMQKIWQRTNIRIHVDKINLVNITVESRIILSHSMSHQNCSAPSLDSFLFLAAVSASA